MAREKCSRCDYILANCICSALAPIANQVNVLCIREKSERDHAKNTAKLIPLLFNNAKLVDSDQDDINHILSEYGIDNSLLIYPDETAVNLDEIATPNNYQNIIVLDGSWKKVFKLLKQFPMLNNYQKVSINLQTATQYSIRKAPRADSMSTLEATASVITVLEELDTSACQVALNALMEQQYKHMPEAVRARYIKN